MVCEGENGVDSKGRMSRKTRPITCLNTRYKLLMAVLKEVLYKHPVLHGVLLEDTKGMPLRPLDRLNGGKGGEA